MTDTPDPLPESLERLLAPPPPGEADTLQRAVFARTEAVLWRRRAVRRLAYAVGLAACYLAGLLSARWLSAPEPVERIVIVPSAPQVAPEAARAASAAELERKARIDVERQADFYRRAGDLYASEQGDLKAALRCYGRALDAGSEEDLAVSANDHWLLMAIKDAREKEKRNAQTEQ